MEIEIGTPVRGIFDDSPLGDRDENGRIREETLRDPDRICEEINRIMRVVEELRATVDGHERRQRVFDGLHEEIDRLSLQIAGLSADGVSERRIEAIDERINGCERTKVTEKQAIDIAHACVAGNRIALRTSSTRSTTRS